ncbi:MFS transporter [soil metagenome]
MWIWPIEETEEGSISRLYNLARPAPAAFRDTFRSLGVRNFRLFFFGQLLSQTGTWMTMVAQTLLILDLTGSGVLLGLLGAAQFGPVLLFGAWAGAVADRVNKRKVLFATQIGALGQSLVLGLVVLTGNATVVTVFSLAAVQGILTAFDNPARRAFVVEMVPNDNLANAVSLNSTLMTTSRVLGPALAGVLIGLVGYAWCFLADSISYLAVIGALVMMRPSDLFPSKPASRSPGQIMAVLHYFASSRDQLVPLVMMAIIGTLAFNFSVTTPLLVTGPLRGTKQAYTLLLSTMSLGSVIGAIATARRREVPFRHLIWSTATFGLGMLLLAFAPTLWAAFPIAIVVGLGSIGFMKTATAIMQLAADPQFRGRVLALQAMVFLGTTPIGAPIVGLIADRFGPRAAIAIGGLACLGAAIWARQSWHGRAVLPAPTAPPLLVD